MQVWKKTNRLLIVDEDVPGGGTAYILSQLLEKQDIYPHLDSQPSLLTAKDHRPAYGTDGDYFSKTVKRRYRRSRLCHHARGKTESVSFNLEE